MGRAHIAAALALGVTLVLVLWSTGELGGADSHASQTDVADQTPGDTLPRSAAKVVPGATNAIGLTVAGNRGSLALEVRDGDTGELVPGATVNIWLRGELNDPPPLDWGPELNSPRVQIAPGSNLQIELIPGKTGQVIQLDLSLEDLERAIASHKDQQKEAGPTHRK